MTDGIEEVRTAFDRRQTVTDLDQNTQKTGIASQSSGESAAAVDLHSDPEDPGASEPQGAGPDGGDGGGLDEASEDILPPGFPVQPLGMAGGKFHFLSARGELVELAAGAISHRSNLVALTAGAKDPIRPLRDIAPPEGKRDTGFNASAAGDMLMQACGKLPLFDKNMPIRHCGTWRGKTGYPVVHMGEDMRVNPAEQRRGRMVSGALYPSVPSRPAPAKSAACAEDVEWIHKRIDRFWNWQSDNAGALIVGWIGQAALGQYPQWRTHLYIHGKNGSGKSTLLRIISDLLGGMSAGVKNSASAASIRQTTNRMAVARIFDEAEKSASGGSEDIIGMFRLMSGSEGAQMERGTSDHSGIRFGLYGAGLLGSIIPGGMSPQDQSRFVMLTLGDRLASDNPEIEAQWLDELEQDAKELGPRIWRRMLDLAPKRWDQAFRIYSGMVQGLGARARAGDTIGAVLAGWDLMLFDDPLVDPKTGHPRPDRIAAAKALAHPLIQQTQEADEMGEGEQLLRAIFGGILHKEHGGIKTVEEEICLLQTMSGNPGPGDNSLIMRLGLRVFGEGADRKKLFISNEGSPLLDKALAGTRWRGGGHKAALETIAGVTKAPAPMRIAGRSVRGVIVPARFLPGYKENPQGGDE